VHLLIYIHLDTADPHLAKINVFLHKLGYTDKNSFDSYYRARTDNQQNCCGLALCLWKSPLVSRAAVIASSLLQLEKATSFNYLKALIRLFKRAHFTLHL